MKNVLNAIRTKTGEWVVSGAQGTQVVVNYSRRASKVVSAGMAVGIVTLMSSMPAHAALDAAVTGLIADLIVDIGLLFAATVAIWAAIRGFAAVFKLGNKFISKAGA